MNRYKILLALFVLAGAIAVPALGAADHRVTVNDNYYDPSDITIEKGDTVTWTWLGDHHSVTFDDGVDSGVKRRPESWSRTFDAYGTYWYHCSVHGIAMSGVVRVPGPITRTCPPFCVPKEVWVPEDFATIAQAVAEVDEGTIINLSPGTHVVSQTVKIDKRDITIRGSRPEFQEPQVQESATAEEEVSPMTRSSTVDGSENPGARGSRSKGKPEPSPSPSPTPTAEPSPSPTPTAEPSPTPTPPVTPEDVIIQAKGGFASAFEVTGEGFTMSTLTIKSFRDSAVDVVRTKRFNLSSLRLLINREYGIRSIGSRFGVINDVYVTGSSRAGVSIQTCELCDVTVSGLNAEGNFNGFEALDAGSVILEGSTLRNNANGVLLRTRVKPSADLQDGTHVFRNTITDNGDPSVPAPSAFRSSETQDLGSGAGIWISGGWRNVIENNWVSGHLYGIAVTAFGSGSMFNRISENTLRESSWADIGWDGLGAGNCFGANAGPEGSVATTDPGGLQTTHRCGGSQNPPGIPTPAVPARLAQHVIDNYYCPELEGICPRD